MNVSFGRRIFPALFTSLFLFIASPGQWAFTPLAWIALLPLLFACHGLSVKQSACLGMICGLAYYLSLIYWIIIALGRYGGLPLWVTVPALVALALYMASYLAVFAAITSWGAGRLPLVWTAPLAWVGLDFVRCRLFSGFPWLDLGYSQFDWPLINQVADLCGHYGITFLIIMVNALLAELFMGRCLSAVKVSRGGKSLLLHSALPLLLLVFTFLYNCWRYQQLEVTLAQAPTLSIGLVQGNIDQSEKWQAELQVQTVDTYLALSTEATSGQPIDLLIWPETALPFFPTDHRLFQRITDQFSSVGGPSLLTGAPHFEVDQDSEATNYFNSAFLISPTSFAKGVALQRYDKEHLVPFGEYIPLQRYLPKALPLVQTMGNFSEGQNSAPLVSDKAKLGILICFESIFPEEARMRVARGANILVNLTNDAWYGRSSAPYQQVPMAVLRAIENRRSLARAANTGISCLVNPLGMVLSASPIFEKMQMSGKLPLLDEVSFYTHYGFLFPLFCLLLLSLMLLYGIFRPDKV
ncbi:MAG: apolipoprotein N-acyltransferase [Desulfobulbaceae bacterium]|nr:apolipoprotein N-acyltransferase [Desulfobulbaceae bacterium]